jgi:hypothetical protein
MFNNFFSENRAVYEIIKKVIEPDMPQIKYNAAHELLHTCWIPKATDTHSEYVILIAFTRQQWLREFARIIRTLPVLLGIYFKSIAVTYVRNSLRTSGIRIYIDGMAFRDYV